MGEEKTGSVQEMERSVETLESQVREQIARARAAATTVLVVGIIVVAVILIILFTYSGPMKEAMEPGNIVDSVQGLAQDRIPELVTQVEGQLAEDAPQHVAAVRREMMNRLPQVRMQIEQAADQQIEKYSNELETRVESVIDDVIAMHKKELSDIIDAAVASDDPEPLRVAFRDSMEELIGTKLDEVLPDYEKNIRLVKYRVERLSQPEERLSPDEKFEKECVQRMLIYIDDFVTEEAKSVTRPGGKAPELPTTERSAEDM